MSLQQSLTSATLGTKILVSLGVVGTSLLYLGRKYYLGTYCPENLKQADLTGQVVLVTGASKGGIGFETVKTLYLMGATVVMAVRDVVRSEKEKKELESEFENHKLKGRLIVMKVVLDDLQSVKGFCQEFLTKFDRLDIIVNNAGIGGMTGLSKQGVEIAFAVNHLSHFLIFHHLKQLLIDTSTRLSKECKVISVSSVGHFHPKTPLKCLEKDDISISDTGINAYCQSKLCNILFTKSLARQFENTKIGCYCLHPGAVNTNVFRHLPFLAKTLLYSFTWYFFRTPESGAQTQIYLALEKMENLTPGSYYDDCKKAKESELSKSIELQDKLWNLSEELIKDFI